MESSRPMNRRFPIRKLNQASAAGNQLCKSAPIDSVGKVRVMPRSTSDVVAMIGCLFFVARPVFAQDLRDIEALDESKKALREIEDLQRMVEDMGAETTSQCLAAVGAGPFCSCLEDNLPFGMTSFVEYVRVVSAPLKDFEDAALDHNSRTVYEISRATRDYCVAYTQGAITDAEYKADRAAAAKGLGPTLRRRVNMLRAKAGQAPSTAGSKLSLRVVGPPAEVLLEGKRLGITPIVGVNVPSGFLSLQLRISGETKHVTIEATPGGETRRIVDIRDQK